MIKAILTVFIFIAGFTSPTTAQYYFKDIISNQQAIAERLALKAFDTRTIKIHSFEANGEESPGFFCEKKISKDYRKIETYTRSNITAKSLHTAVYNHHDQLVRSTDSSDLSVSTSLYEYDDKGNIFRITSTSHSHDDDFATRLLEVHEYTYNENGKPVKMRLTRNNRDTSNVLFLLDDKGNVIDENDQGKNGKHYYYYYNDKNQLTDIVKFNNVRNKLTPDFLFEYNSQGQVTQMTTVEEGISGDYYTWKYVYNDGLRIIEKCFSKEKILLGYFEYEYD